MAFGEKDDRTARARTALQVCKDYMTDTLVYVEEGYKEQGVYFNYQGPITTDRTTFVFRISPNFLPNVEMFQEYERSLELTPTEIHTTQNAGYILVEGDPWWMKTTIHLSLYLSWMRNCSISGISKTLEELTAEPYIFSHMPHIMRLPEALKKLNITIKRNAPSRDLMHSINGHHSLLSIPQMRSTMTYGKQLFEINPVLFYQYQ
jgi:hypothetical protein